MFKSISLLISVFLFITLIQVSGYSKGRAFNQLMPGETLVPFNPKRKKKRRSFLVSENGVYLLLLQGDGNLVLYKRTDLVGNCTPIWFSGTNGRAVKQLVMQGDGNLVLYGPGNEVLWSSGAQGAGAYLKLGNDGNLIIYKPGWATNTSGR